MRALSALLVFLALATPAAAADFSVTVKNAAGQPVKDAVVTLTPAAGVHGPIKFDWPMQMAQQNLQFNPFVLIVPVGADVSFPNRDSVRHHVYSFSPAKRFELKLYGKDETRSVHFDKVGVVALGCNIHDTMVGFIKVVDTPYAAKSDAAGQVNLKDVPAGPAVLHVWQPYLKGPNNEVARTVAVPAQGEGHEALVVDVRPPPAPMAMH
jgi:plastocyanin